MVRIYEVRIKGCQPLLMHGTAGLDPTHPLKKRAAEITGKRGQKKTDSDLAELDWIDFQLALYHDGKQVVVPDSWILGTIAAGARSRRMGREAASGIEVDGEYFPLEYAGPKDAKGLYDKKFLDRRPVRVQKASVMRCRPRFNEWALTFSLLIEDSVINPEIVKGALEWASRREGIGDFRPRFGRFSVEQWKEIQ